ncbi:MAG TPA: hypothetical protein VLL97_03325 [Acidobacteriota bacterium]|nr:hypothetical protein [Acidobacteriota bacterium]
MSNNFSPKTKPSAKRRTGTDVEAPFGTGSGIFAVCILLIFFATSATAHEPKPDYGNKERTDTEILSLINSTGMPYRAGNRQDPFFNPTPVKTNSNDQGEEVPRGLPPPGIAGTYIAQAVLEGISVGNTRRTAVVRGADERAFFLREGDRLFDGYLKTINDDSVTFVRETRMRSGKMLTQEVTKRLRKP